MADETPFKDQPTSKIRTIQIQLDEQTRAFYRACHAARQAEEANAPLRLARLMADLDEEITQISVEGHATSAISYIFDELYELMLERGIIDPTTSEEAAS